MTYTHGHHESVLRSHRWRTVENSAAYVGADFVAGRAGARRRLRTGHDHARHRRPRSRPGSVIGIDAVGRRDRPGAGADAADVDNVEFATGDVYALDFADASFDVVHAHQVLQHLPDPVGALREMRRVCKPGRRRRRARQRLRRVHAGIPTDPSSTRWLDAVPRRSRAPTRASPTRAAFLLAWAHAAGFSDVAPARRRGASRRPTTAPGGATSGPTA